MKNDGANGLIVLGMHRSGTSCLAGMLQRAGFVTGSVDEWNPDNSFGNRENLKVLDLNSQVLADSGGDWKHLPRSIRFTREHQHQAKAVLDELSDQASLWAFKDPRTLLTAKMWLSIAPKVKLIGVFRHPLAVYLSLQKRDGMGASQALSLWSDYNERLIALLEKQPFPLIMFQEDSAVFSDDLRAALLRLFPSEFDDSVLESESLQAFFSSQLHHHSFSAKARLSEALDRLSIGSSPSNRTQSVWAKLLSFQNPKSTPSGAMRGVSDSVRNETAAEVIPDDQQAGAQTLESIDLLLEDSPGQVEYLRRGIEIHQRDGQGAELIDWLKRWLKKTPDNPFLLWELAQLEWAAGNRTSAIVYAETCREKAPSWLAPLRPLARWYFDSEMWREAAKTYREMEQLGNQSGQGAGQYVAQLYLDFGHGFSEANSVKAGFFAENSWVDVVFDCKNLDQRLLQLRVDPTTKAAVISELSVVSSGETGSDVEWVAKQSNALIFENDTYYFQTSDPQVVLSAAEVGASIRTVRLRFKIQNIATSAIEKTADRLLQLVLELASDSGRNIGTSIVQGTDKPQLAQFVLDQGPLGISTAESCLTKELLGTFEHLNPIETELLHGMVNLSEQAEANLKAQLLSTTKKLAWQLEGRAKTDQAHHNMVKELESENRELLELIERLRDSDLGKTESLEHRYREISVLTQLAEQREQTRVAGEKQLIDRDVEADYMRGLLGELDTTLQEIESSLSWRLASRLMRLLMRPLSFGLGPTILDQLDEKLQALRSKLAED